MRLTSFPQFGRSNGTRYIALPYNQARFGTLAACWDDDRDALGLLQQTGIYCAFEQSMLQVTLALPRFSMEKRGMSMQRPLMRRGVGAHVQSGNGSAGRLSTSRFPNPKKQRSPKEPPHPAIEIPGRITQQGLLKPSRKATPRRPVTPSKPFSGFRVETAR